MLQIVGLLLPLFSLIAMGQLAIKRKLVTEGGLAALTGFTYWLALPALLFGAAANGRSQNSLEVALIYLSCCIVVFGFATVMSFIFFGRSVSRAAIFGLNSTYGNVIYLGTPVVASVFGSQGIPFILAVITFHSGLLLPLASILIEIDSPRQGGPIALIWGTVKALVCNPIVTSITVGFVWQAADIPLPLPFRQFCNIIGPAASPLALFCLGASLPSIATGRRMVGEAIMAIIFKLAILPASIGLVSWHMSLTGLPLKVAVVTASMPTGANVFLLASRAMVHAESSAATVVVASALSIITLALVLTYMT